MNHPDDDFLRDARERLARAFIAAYGPERGEEALAEAMAFAWERSDQLRDMENPVGYLYRVGQSRSRSRHRRHRLFPAGDAVGLPNIEPGLPAALDSLTERQRVAVVLVEGLGWTLQEVGDLLGVSRSTIQNHLERGLGRLRASLGVEECT